MAKVPVIQQQVQEQALGGRTFQAGNPMARNQQLQTQTYNESQKLFKEAQKVFEFEAEKASDISALEAENQLRKMQYDSLYRVDKEGREVGFYGTKGKTALEQSGKVREDHDKYYQELAGGLSDRARILFEKRTARGVQGYYNNIQKHAFTQHQKYTLDTVQETLAIEEQKILREIYDNQSFTEGLQKMDRAIATGGMALGKFTPREVEIIRKGQYSGASQTDIDNMYKTLRSNSWYNLTTKTQKSKMIRLSISNLVDSGKYQQARDVYEANIKKSGKDNLLPEDQDKVIKLINKGNDLDNIYRYSDAVIDRVSKGDLKTIDDIRAEVKRMNVPSIYREKVMQQVNGYRIKKLQDDARIKTANFKNAKKYILDVSSTPEFKQHLAQGGTPSSFLEQKNPTLYLDLGGDDTMILDSSVDKAMRTKISAESYAKFLNLKDSGLLELTEDQLYSDHLKYMNNTTAERALKKWKIANGLIQRKITPAMRPMIDKLQNLYARKYLARKYSAGNYSKWNDLDKRYLEEMQSRVLDDYEEFKKDPKAKDFDEDASIKKHLEGVIYNDGFSLFGFGGGPDEIPKGKLQDIILAGDFEWDKIPPPQGKVGEEISNSLLSLQSMVGFPSDAKNRQLYGHYQAFAKENQSIYDFIENTIPDVYRSKIDVELFNAEIPPHEGHYKVLSIYYMMGLEDRAKAYLNKHKPKED